MKGNPKRVAFLFDTFKKGMKMSCLQSDDNQKNRNSCNMLNMPCFNFLVLLLAADIICYIMYSIPCTIDFIFTYPEKIPHIVLSNILIWLTIALTAYTIPKAAHEIIIRKFPETKKFLQIYRYVLSIMIVISGLIIIYFRDSLISLVPATLGVYSVCMGWWIQAMNTAKNSRRSHTLNVIMSSKNSTVYNDHIKKCEGLVPNRFYLGREICKDFANKDKSPQYKHNNKALKSDEKEILFDAIKSCIYILNYFEFICCGIKKGDLDEELIRGCYESFFKGADEAFCFLMIEIRENQPTAFENLIEMIQKWHSTSKCLELADREDDPSLGTKAPTDEYMQNKVLDKKLESEV